LYLWLWLLFERDGLFRSGVFARRRSYNVTRQGLFLVLFARFFGCGCGFGACLLLVWLDRAVGRGFGRTKVECGADSDLNQYEQKQAIDQYPEEHITRKNVQLQPQQQSQ
jgi:hypothetical protein